MTTIRQRKEESHEEAEMPVVTALLDLSFQLLAFFILTFDPSPVREGQMQMALPPKDVTGPSKTIVPPTEPKKDEVPELPTEIDITLTQKPNGYEIQVEEGVVSEKFFTLVELNEHLRETFERHRGKIESNAGYDADAIAEEIGKIGVTIRATSTLPWGDVIEVIDSCRLAGFTSITPAKPPDIASDK